MTTTYTPTTVETWPEQLAVAVEQVRETLIDEGFDPDLYDLNEIVRQTHMMRGDGYRLAVDHQRFWQLVEHCRLGCVEYVGLQELRTSQCPNWCREHVLGECGDDLSVVIHQRDFTAGEMTFTLEQVTGDEQAGSVVRLVIPQFVDGLTPREYSQLLSGLLKVSAFMPDDAFQAGFLDAMPGADAMEWPPCTS